MLILEVLGAKGLRVRLSFSKWKKKPNDDLQLSAAAHTKRCKLLLLLLLLGSPTTPHLICSEANLKGYTSTCDAAAAAALKK